MSIKVRIPTPLQKLTNNQAEVQCDAANVNELLASLEKQYPGIKERLCDAEGKLRRVALKAGDDISIIPAIAGGAPLDRKRVTLVFPQNLIQEPVVFTMAKKFDIMPNIRRARVTESVGEMTLELEGEDKNLDKGIKYLESRGVKVEPVTGESAL
jgi:molybdopterin converting factor small subunit